MDDSQSSSSPLVSIVIPTWNDERTIETCLNSCLNQSYEEIEIIVVDNNSDDATPKICRQYPITLIQEESGMAEARNIGAESAVGEYLYHVDADMELSQRVVEECVSYCYKDDFQALMIPERNVGAGYWSNCLRFGKQINRNEEEGNLRFLESRLYEQVGGHDSERLSGEDWDLHQRVSDQTEAKIGHINEIVYHHVQHLSFFEILKKKRQYAQSQQEIPSDQRRELRPVGILKKNLRNMGMFVDSPRHAIGYIFINLINALMVRYYRLRGSQ